MEHLVLEKQPEKEEWHLGDVLISKDGDGAVGMIVERMDESFVLLDITGDTYSCFSTINEDALDGPYDALEDLQSDLEKSWKRYDSFLLVGSKTEIAKYKADLILHGGVVNEDKELSQSAAIYQDRTLESVKRKINAEAKKYMDEGWHLEKLGSGWALVNDDEHYLVRILPTALTTPNALSMFEDAPINKKMDITGFLFAAMDLLKDNGFFKEKDND